jgi:predicted dehydrogenase
MNSRNQAKERIEMVALALVGCGGMGLRHIRGLEKLRKIGELHTELVAVCDVVPENAERAATLAEDLLGTRPNAFASIAGMHDSGIRADAVMVATAPDLHASVGIAAFEFGLHVMVEKPIALTVGQGASLVEAGKRANRKLAVAENYRRDPMNRLARDLIDAGVLGSVHLVVQSSSGSGERVIITPWRHQKQSGGIVVDMGIHYADLLEYYAGPLKSMFGFSAVVDQRRVDNAGTWHEVDAEDLSVGVAQFENGAIANWLIDLAGRGESHFSRVIYGTRGSLSIPPDRTGRPLGLTLRRDGSDTQVDPSGLLSLVPNFALDDVTARLFGGTRLASYQLDFPDVDANLLAIEHADFSSAILNDRPPEVDGTIGLRSLAISYGFLEAERLGKAITVTEMLQNFDLPYQKELARAAR